MPAQLQRILAQNASRALGAPPQGVHRTLEVIASGKSPKLPIGSDPFLVTGRTWIPEIRAASQGMRHAKDGLIYLRAAKAVLCDISKLLDRAQSAAEQAQAPEATDIERSNHDAAYQSILAILNQNALTREFNGEPLFGAKPLVIPLGSLPEIQLEYLEYRLSGDLQTRRGAQEVIRLLEEARLVLARQYSDIGVAATRLASLADIWGIQGENFAAITNRMRDGNLADGVVGLAKFQILNCSGHSPLTATLGSSEGLYSLLR
ncbi:MAG: hypothetical protein Q8O00_09665 [Holophaga sp.]|nr:hypothetical protein [Holophaga sp.]